MKQRGENNWSPIPEVASARRDEHKSRESRPGDETKPGPTYCRVNKVETSLSGALLYLIYCFGGDSSNYCN